MSKWIRTQITYGAILLGCMFTGWVICVIGLSLMGVL